MGVLIERLGEWIADLLVARPRHTSWCAYAKWAEREYVYPERLRRHLSLGLCAQYGCQRQERRWARQPFGPLRYRD